MRRNAALYVPEPINSLSNVNDKSVPALALLLKDYALSAKECLVLSFPRRMPTGRALADDLAHGIRVTIQLSVSVLLMSFDHAEDDSNQNCVQKRPSALIWPWSAFWYSTKLLSSYTYLTLLICLCSG